MRIKIHFAFVVFMALLTFFPESGQSQLPASTSSNVSPETGFLSPSKYTNAFFGFSIPLPQNAGLVEQTLSLNRGPRDHLLLSFHSPTKGLVNFRITAREVTGESEKEAKRSAAGPNELKVNQTKIAGKTFWRSQSATKPWQGKMQALIFSTAVGNYVLQFEVTSYNPELTSEIEHDIELLTFFDPSRAIAAAGDNKPYVPGVSRFIANDISGLSLGSVSGNVYRNQELGFHYEFPQGWVLMSKAQEQSIAEAGHQFMWGNSPAAQQEHEAASQCTRNLLLVRRYVQPPQGGQFDPMILLTAADPKCVSALSFPKAIDDREAIQQIAKQIVQYFKTANMSSTEPARVRAFNIAGRIMIELSQSFTLTPPGQVDPTNFLSSMLIMQAGNYWVIWMFAAGDKSELDQMRNTKIFFDDPVAPKNATP